MGDRTSFATSSEGPDLQWLTLTMAKRHSECLTGRMRLLLGGRAARAVILTKRRRDA